MQKLQKIKPNPIAISPSGTTISNNDVVCATIFAKNHLYHSGESVLLAMTGTKPFSVNPPVNFHSLALT